MERLDELGDVLDAAAVAARYGLADRRTARAIMRATGSAFTVARRLYVRRAALEALGVRSRRRARRGAPGARGAAGAAEGPTSSRELVLPPAAILAQMIASGPASSL